jgi:cytochrome c oxidase subunit 4
MTVTTVVVARIDLGRLNAIAALSIAVFKGTLVVLYFMHVRYSSKLTWVFVLAGFFWLAILIAFTLSDFLTRPWQQLPI